MGCVGSKEFNTFVHFEGMAIRLRLNPLFLEPTPDTMRSVSRPLGPPTAAINTAIGALV